MKKFLFFCLVFHSVFLCASEVSVVSAGFDFDSPRSSVLAKQIDYHLANIFLQNSNVDYIKSSDFQRYLKRDKIITYEKIIQTAYNLKIDIVIFCEIVDKNDKLHFSMTAFANNFPFNGSRLLTFNKSIELDSDYNSQNYNLITEDLCIQFVSRVFRKFLSLEQLAAKKDTQMYKKVVNDDFVTFKKTDIFVENETYYLKDYIEDADYLDSILYQKKTELVFSDASVEQRAFLMLSTPLFSLVSPIIVPFSYLGQNDYSAFGIWALNSAPYYYMASQTFLRHPMSYRDYGGETKKLYKAGYCFSIYYLFAGSMPFLIDSIANPYLDSSSIYKKSPYFIGDEFSAVWFSLVSGGGGHFYKGYRLKGYLFFHLHNILLYSTLYNLMTNEIYDEKTGNYTHSGKKYNYAIISISSFAVIKIIEIIDLKRLPFDVEMGQEDNIYFSLNAFPKEDGIESFSFSVGYKF